MTIAEMSAWGRIKALLWIIFCSEERVMAPEKLMAILEESNIKSIRVTGRGGIEISVEELKNSEHFKNLEIQSSERVQRDLERLSQTENR